MDLSLSYPAGFIFIASINACPCGYYDNPIYECTCYGNYTACGARIDDNLKDWESTTKAVNCEKMVVNKINNFFIAYKNFQ